MAKPARPSAVRAEDLLEGDVTKYGVVREVIGEGDCVTVIFSRPMLRREYVDIET